MLKLELQQQDGSLIYIGEAPNFPTASAMIASLDAQWVESHNWRNPPSQEEMDKVEKSLTPILQNWEGKIIATEVETGKTFMEMKNEWKQF